MFNNVVYLGLFECIDIYRFGDFDYGCYFCNEVFVVDEE